MLYILTEEELAKLKEEQNAMRKIAQGKLQKLCTEIANTMPIDWQWPGDDEAKPWGCIFTDPDWYCDSCPVREICPYDSKQWSK